MPEPTLRFLTGCCPHTATIRCRYRAFPNIANLPRRTLRFWMIVRVYSLERGGQSHGVIFNEFYKKGCYANDSSYSLQRACRSRSANMDNRDRPSAPVLEMNSRARSMLSITK